MRIAARAEDLRFEGNHHSDSPPKRGLTALMGGWHVVHHIISASLECTSRILDGGGGVIGIPVG